MQLDARQRAMLQEMGVRVWTAPQAHQSTAERECEAAPVHSLTAATQALPQVQTPRPPRAVQPPPLTPPSTPERSSATSPSQWHVQAPYLLYPDADPALTPPALGLGWLVVAEAFAADDPLTASAERLLANMLHALQLHRHPRVWLCSVAPPSGAASVESDSAMTIARHVEAFTPSVVLVMGRDAVRAALARSEPLGKLRSTELTIAGVPAVVTFGPHFLLRSPESKPAAWADLCRARALAGNGRAGPVP